MAAARARSRHPSARLPHSTPTPSRPPAWGISRRTGGFQDGDHFGRAVNIAARIAGYARPGEVLVSQEVVRTSIDGTPATFMQIGPVELKGVSGSLRLHTARRVA